MKLKFFIWAWKIVCTKFTSKTTKKLVHIRIKQAISTGLENAVPHFTHHKFQTAQIYRFHPH